MTDTADIQAVATLFALLSEPTRVRLLYLLAGGERNVTDLCAALGMLQPTLSHHLGLLRRGGVLDCRRDGKQVYYRWGHTVARNADGTLVLKARGLSVRIEPAATAVALTVATLDAATRLVDAVPDGGQVAALAGSSR